MPPIDASALAGRVFDAYTSFLGDNVYAPTVNSTAAAHQLSNILIGFKDVDSPHCRTCDAQLSQEGLSMEVEEGGKIFIRGKDWSGNGEMSVSAEIGGTEPRSDPSLPKSVQVGDLVLRINDDILKGKFVALNSESAEADEEARQQFAGVSKMVKRKWANVHCVVL